jgi:hypothetical protein
MDTMTDAMVGSGDGVLGVLHEVLEEQALVARAEAALDAARRRLAASEAKLGRLMPVEPALAELLTANGVTPRAPRGPRERREGDRPQATMRARILEVMAASPAEVFTPARLAPLVDARSRDSVRNTLLVLARARKVEKLAPGQYRARCATARIAA